MGPPRRLAGPARTRYRLPHVLLSGLPRRSRVRAGGLAGRQGFEPRNAGSEAQVSTSTVTDRVGFVRVCGRDLPAGWGGKGRCRAQSIEILSRSGDAWRCRFQAIPISPTFNCRSSRGPSRPAPTVSAGAPDVGIGWPNLAAGSRRGHRRMPERREGGAVQKQHTP